VTIYEQLEIARGHLSHQQAADNLGISVQHLRNLENGRFLPSFGLLQKMARIYQYVFEIGDHNHTGMMQGRKMACDTI
jgi:transcriptional regulator with XRE-family HTH domain